ncbi:cofilin [Pseudohyphozyma bogoriensis]|nr:cofilin [Pseudohyphozyma bogoriensis]
MSCLDTFQELKLGKKLKYIIFKLSDDNKEIQVEKTSSSADYDEFLNDLPAQSCRYAIYDFEYQKGSDGLRNKICFYAWSPDESKIKTKMLYASSKDALRRALVGIAVEIQGTDSSEIDYSEVLDKVSRGTSFERNLLLREIVDLTFPLVEQQAPNPASHYSYDAEGNITFHVWRVKVFSHDDKITGANKDHVLYYLRFPHHIGQWHMSLHAGDSENAPLVMKIDKDFIRSSFHITMDNGWKTDLLKSGLLSRDHEFTSFDGQSKYKWHHDGIIRDHWTCSRVDNGEVVGKWHHAFSIRQDGTLTVMAKYAAEAVLILGTGLAIEEWREAQRKERGAKLELLSH